MTIKAITLAQPWATLIAIGAKKIETRSWKTNYRGPLAIHAAKDIPKYAYDLAKHDFAEYLYGVGILPTGCIVAFGWLVDCVKVLEFCGLDDMRVESAHDGSRRIMHISRDEFRVGNFEAGRFAWLLDRVEKVRPSIDPGHGFHRGLWNWTPPVEVQCRIDELRRTR